jgi:SagB-type dehydrogenase family enzyme
MSNAQAVVKAYHQRTKHQQGRYAAGPEVLDWDLQPNPFRTWAGAPLSLLPLVADALLPSWGDLATPGKVPPQAMNRRNLAALFELSFALTAWKQYGPDRWALRANPSSGNLHPTEAYALTRGVQGLADGLYHYEPREHALARRASLAAAESVGDAPQLWIGLSSIQWREAWKYGERAFRYCQLDTGHAVGALRYAAAVLGWQARVVSGLSHGELAGLMGLDRDADFGKAEREEPELLMQIGPDLGTVRSPDLACLDGASWLGEANRLDTHPMYRWPIIDEVAQATRAVSPLAGNDVAVPCGAAERNVDGPGTASLRSAELAATLIRGRRSAQHFDRKATMPQAAFWRMMQAVMPEAGLPWDAWPHTPRVHLVLFAHRVDGLAAGAYVLPRSAAGIALLADVLLAGQAWQHVPGTPVGLPLQCLSENPALAGTLRTLSCHQAIASDACFTLSMLAEFDEQVEAQASHYRTLYQEAGLLGQVLYMQAEAEGFRGTGIGCYFDDAVHELLGLRHQQLQALYHFTVGVPMADTRISTEPPYAHRAPISDTDETPS